MLERLPRVLLRLENPAHLTWYWVTASARRSATMSSGSYTSSPAAGSKAVCGVRFFPLPCAFSAGAGGSFGFFFPLPLPPIAGVVWARDVRATRHERGNTPPRSRSRGWVVTARRSDGGQDGPVRGRAARISMSRFEGIDIITLGLLRAHTLNFFFQTPLAAALAHSTFTT